MAGHTLTANFGQPSARFSRHFQDRFIRHSSRISAGQTRVFWPNRVFWRPFGGRNLENMAKFGAKLAVLSGCGSKMATFWPNLRYTFRLKFSHLKYPRQKVSKSCMYWPVIVNLWRVCSSALGVSPAARGTPSLNALTRGARRAIGAPKCIQKMRQSLFFPMVPNLR